MAPDDQIRLLKEQQQSLLRVMNVALSLDLPIVLTGPYTNWRGETKVRRIRPSSVWSGVSEFHPDSDLFLTGFDLDRQAVRHFSIEDFDLVALKAEIAEAAD